MPKPLVNSRFEAYFCGRLEASTVVEWTGNLCYFSNGYYLVWGGESIGFLL
jgi:hypothetical protein